MNRSESGKLGWLKSKAIHDAKYKERVDTTDEKDIGKEKVHNLYQHWNLYNARKNC